jgi:hypothetical protein
MCGGTGIAGTGMVNGRPCLDGCTYCGGRPTPRDGSGPGAPGSGQAMIPCPDCKGTGRIKTVQRDNGAWRAADEARRATEKKMRAARQVTLDLELACIRSDKQKIKVLEDLRTSLVHAGPPSELTPAGTPSRKIEPAVDPSSGSRLEIDHGAVPANPQLADIARGLAAIKVPPPMPADRADVDFHLAEGNDDRAKWILRGTETGVILLDLSGQFGEHSLLGVKVLLATGKTFIAMEDAADVYLVKQNAVCEQALGYLKSPKTAQQFTAVVKVLRDGRPTPADAPVDMVRAARAILDPRLGNSGTRIAWSAMWSPEAKRAGLTRATIELGGELFGEGAKGIVKDLKLAQDPAFQYASDSLTKAQTALGTATRPAEREAAQKVIDVANRVLDRCYRSSETAGQAADHAASIFTKETTEHGLDIER